MLTLLGRPLSPYVRRTAITLTLYEMPFRQLPMSAFDDAGEVRRYNPLGRVPALVLDNGETLVESTSIISYLDGLVAPGRCLTPAASAPRLRVLQIVGLALGAVDKAVAAVYERTRKGADGMSEAWAERCDVQAAAGFAALAGRIGTPWAVGDAVTQADVTTVAAWDFVAAAHPTLRERLDGSALDALSEQAGRLPAFADTRPA